MGLSWTDGIEGVLPYQRFSVEPLTPLSVETERRIAQLMDDLRFVSGLTVLDIGCASGLASIIALSLGAKVVKAVDVDARYLSSIQGWANQTRRPLESRQADFLSLGEPDRSEVVLLLEVYHWLAHQGLSPQVVAGKLCELASRYILLESPFDSQDPSILRAMAGRTNEYRLDILLDSLVKSGWTVRFLGITDYFPSEYNRARFLVEKNT